MTTQADFRPFRTLGQVALEYCRRHGSDKVRVITLAKNRGKGGAVKMVTCHSAWWMRVRRGPRSRLCGGQRGDPPELRARGRGGRAPRQDAWVLGGATG